MSAATLRQKLSAGQRLLGLCNNYPAAGILESMCKGWDFVWIDGQHGQMSYDSTLHAIRTAAALNIETLVRVAGHDPAQLALFADIAPSALMIPMVNTAEQAQTIARAVSFPPHGDRSYGGRRPIDLFGRAFFETENPVVVAQIETAEGAANAEAIINSHGIDMLFFGADDLKLSLGLPIDMPQTDDKRVLAAMEKTAAVARAAKKFSGCVAANPAIVTLAVGMGYQFLIGGADSAFLRAAATERLNTLRKLIPI